MKIATIILRCFVALAFIGAAGVKLSSAGEFGQRLSDWGYPGWYYYLVISVELIGAVGLLFPKTADPAAGVLILLMLGAIYTHFSHGESLATASPAILLLLSLSSIVILRRRHRSAISL